MASNHRSDIMLQPVSMKTGHETSNSPQ